MKTKKYRPPLLFFARMWDLSAFMHDLKLRFAKWFNRGHERDGILRSENFRSVLVESGHAARMVGAYIDLKPVREGIVKEKITEELFHLKCT